MANISDLKFDDKNFNAHTEYGMSLLEKSLQQFGAGRSILIDKNNNIIAGNGVVEAAGNIGLEDMQIVETKGDKIVAVKRTDIELNSAKGRGLAMADNAVASVNLSWDEDNVEEQQEEWGFDSGDWGVTFSHEPHDYFGDERERTYKSTNLDYFDPETSKNKYGFPELKGTNKIPTSLVGFNEVKTTDDTSATVHFFIDDYQFERVWNSPKKYIDLLQKFDCVCTPDFSLYMDMPLAMKIWNTYRSRLIGKILEDEGIAVIPTLSWAGKDTFEFVFDGLPKGSTVAVSTVGVMKNDNAQRAWVEGMKIALAKLQPSAVVLYGSPIDFDWGDTKVVNFKAGGFHGV